MLFIFGSWRDLNTKISSVSPIHLCRNEPGFIKLVLFWKNHFIPSQYHNLSMHSSHISEGSWKGEPQKHQGLLIESWSQTRVDCGEGNSWKNKSCVFIFFVARKPKPKLEFCGSGNFCASQSFYTDGSGLRIRRFIHQREQGLASVPELPILMPKYILEPGKMRTKRRWF